MVWYVPYTIFPIVCNLDPPTGHLFASSLLDFICKKNKRILDPISNTESIPVASKERDSEDAAAYTEHLRGGS